jgi:hypothetical protein
LTTANQCTTDHHPQGVNLNDGFRRFETAAELYADIRHRTSQAGDYIVRNYCAVIADMRPEAVLVETELFPRGAIEFYTAKNMGWEYTKEQEAEWQLVERGGGQGDYRDGMKARTAPAKSCSLFIPPLTLVPPLIDGRKRSPTWWRA